MVICFINKRILILLYKSIGINISFFRMYFNIFILSFGKPVDFFVAEELRIWNSSSFIFNSKSSQTLLFQKPSGLRWYVTKKYINYNWDNYRRSLFLQKAEMNEFLAFLEIQYLVHISHMVGCDISGL